MLNHYLDHRADRAAAELRHWENLQVADRHHRETVALCATGLVAMAALVVIATENRPPAPPAPNPDLTAAIADLQQSIDRLIQMVSEIQHQMQNSNGNGNAPTQSND